jgi:protoporphyrinogen oxidase
VTTLSAKGPELEVAFTHRGREQRQRFRRVISTLPLPELVPMVEEAPAEVRRAAGELVFTSLLCMGLGVGRRGISDKHSIYYPEKEYLFNRISFPMNIAPYTAPKGKSSILAEVTCKKGERPNARRAGDRIVSGLVKAGILRRGDDIEARQVQTYGHAYVVYDLDHRKNVDLVHRYLRSIGVVPAGRFGEWEYLNMDRSMLSGMRAAKEALDKRLHD